MGIDLAHAFANVPLALHDWGVDFAAWCTYKYGCSGPGGIGGLFIHEKHGRSSHGGDSDGADAPRSNSQLLRPAGWWGHNRATRFAMPATFDAIPGAAGWQLSNPSVLDLASLRGSLETLALCIGGVGVGAGADTANGTTTTTMATSAWAEEREAQTHLGCGSIMPILRRRSLALTGYLEHLLFECAENTHVLQRAGLQLITPSDPMHRGSQLSVCVPNLDTDADPHATGDAPGPHTTPAATSSSTSTATSTSSNGQQAQPPSSVPPPLAKTSLVSRIQSHAEEHYGLIADIRNPDVTRLAPLAQYSTFEDVWRAVEALKASVEAVLGPRA